MRHWISSSKTPREHSYQQWKIEYALLTTNVLYALQTDWSKEVTSYHKNTANAMRALHPSAVLMTGN